MTFIRYFGTVQKGVVGPGQRGASQSGHTFVMPVDAEVASHLKKARYLGTQSNALEQANYQTLKFGAERSRADRAEGGLEAVTADQHRLLLEFKAVLAK